MARIVTLLLVLGAFLPSALAEETEVRPGLITASNVDITADDGSLLAERLNTGDMVFIVSNPKEKKKGWVRISRTADDKVGYGWVEEKHVRPFRQYERTQGATGAPSSELLGEPVQPPAERALPATSAQQGPYGKVAVVPFRLAEADDTVGKWTYDAFSTSIKNKAGFSIVTAPKTQADLDSIVELKKMSRLLNVDGLFVGKISGEIAGNRLFQIRFFDAKKESFVIEKTTKLPREGNLQRVVDGLVTTCLDMLSKS